MRRKPAAAPLLQRPRRQHVDAELQFRDVDRREVHRILVRDGVKVGRTQPPRSTATQMLVSISQPTDS